MRLVKKGATSQDVSIYAIDNTTGLAKTGLVFNSAGISINYRRESGAVVGITLVTLAALTTAWTSGGFKEIGNGWYRLDVPDAAFVSGADHVLIEGTVTGAQFLTTTVQLSNIDIMDAVRLGLSALPNASAGANGGLPLGDGNGRVDVSALSGSTISAVNLKDFADSGYDSITNKVQGVALVDTTTTLTGHTAQTGDNFARIGVNGAGLSNINLPNQTMDITGNISGSVGSVTAAVTAGTVTDKTGYSLAATGLDLITSTATGAIALAKSIWDALVTSHQVVGSFGELENLTNASVNSIGSGGGGSIPIEFTDDNTVGGALKGVTFVGVETAGTFATTNTNPTTYHNIDDTGNNIDIVYYTNIGSDKQLISILWQGYLLGSNDVCNISLYDFVGAAWDIQYQIEGQASAGNIIEPAIRALSRHTGTGAEIGDVYVRFTCTAQSNPSLFNATLYSEVINTSTSIGNSLGAIWIDTVNGVDGTDPAVNGKADNPCLTWANVLSLSATQNINKIGIFNGSVITLTGDTSNFTLFGDNWTLNLNGQIITDISIDGALSITGTSTGTGVRFKNCDFGIATVPPGEYSGCGIEDIITQSAAGDYVLISCYSEIGSPIWDMGAAIGNTNLNMLDHRGGNLELRNIGATGTDIVNFTGMANLTLASSCTGGTIDIHGEIDLTDNSAGTTVNIEATYNVGRILTQANISNSTQGNTSFGIVTDVGNTTSTFKTDLTASVDGYYDQPQLIKCISGVNAGQTKELHTSTSYNGTTKFITLLSGESFSNIPVNGDSYIIVSL